MESYYSVPTVRAAEKALLAATAPEQLMRLAAHAVARAAVQMVSPGAPILVVAGPGGNGGDGLYAGAFLLGAGYSVDAVLAANAAHTPALEAFKLAGGSVREEPDYESVASYALIIDAVAGLGAGRAICAAHDYLFRQAKQILSVDVPSGINAETGVAASPCVHADATITFGGPRPAHALAPECGEIVIADLTPRGAPYSFSEELLHRSWELTTRIASGILAAEKSLPPRFTWNEALENAPTDTAAGHIDTEEGTLRLRPAASFHDIHDPTPGPADDKYSGGVVALCAGSKPYAGAGILCAGGALRATPSMVRIIGRREVVHAHPEVVYHEDVASAGRAQAWVVGPGRGLKCAAEILQVLMKGQPTVLDADALAVLAGNKAVQKAVRNHPLVVLTPHAGEFERIYSAVFGSYEPSRGRAVLAQQLAEELNCFVLLKGRKTVLAGYPRITVTVDAGNSYAATPGSGDVLAGIVGAWLAHAHLEHTRPEDRALAVVDALGEAVAIHAHAAAIAAATPEGLAPTTASEIARCIPTAIARLTATRR